MADAGGASDANNLTITFDDEAAEDITSLSQLVCGTFRPGNGVGSDIFPPPAPVPNGNSALSAFDGQKPNGQWQLYIVDDAAGAVGALNDGWQLQITAKVKDKGKKGK
jgi:hypothetical protein